MKALFLACLIFLLSGLAAAQTQLENVFTASPNPVFGFALARAYIRVGNMATLYETLEKCVALGGISPDPLSREADFSAIKAKSDSSIS